MNTNHFYILLASILLLTACKEDEEEVTVPSVTGINCVDSLVFEHSGTATLAVSATSSNGAAMIGSLGELPAGFTLAEDDLTLPANFELSFNQTGAVPFRRSVQLNVAIPNVNATPLTKTVYLVYRPTCAYDFIDHSIGQITYTINGILNQNNITCSYNTSGQLVVQGLQPFTVVLDVDCATGAVSMPATVNLSWIVTASGQINGDAIDLTFFNNGVESAVARILP